MRHGVREGVPQVNQPGRQALARRAHVVGRIYVQRLTTLARQDGHGLPGAPAPNGLSGPCRRRRAVRTNQTAKMNTAEVHQALKQCPTTLVTAVKPTEQLRGHPA